MTDLANDGRAIWVGTFADAEAAVADRVRVHGDRFEFEIKHAAVADLPCAHEAREPVDLGDYGPALWCSSCGAIEDTREYGVERWRAPRNR